MNATVEPVLKGVSVEQWNDAFAREHDIDQYYGAASPLIRWIENSRLRLIREMLQPGPGHRILEVGCGGGHVLRMFPQCILTGVDVSGEMIAKARRNLDGYPVRLLKGELGELDLPEGGFDRIVCSEVLEHVVHPEELVESMGRLLAPGGRAVITIPNDALIHRIKLLIRTAKLDLLPPLRRIAWGGDQYHLHVWKIAEMRSLLGRFFAVRKVRCAPSRALPIRACFAVTHASSAKSPNVQKSKSPNVQTSKSPKM
jgi:SAM-dependent methyltransferase